MSRGGDEEEEGGVIYINNFYSPSAASLSMAL